MDVENVESEAGELESQFPRLSKGVRRALASAAEDNAHVLANRLLELSKAEKETSTTCPHCNKRHTVRMPDSSAATNAIKVLLEQGKAKEEEREIRTPSAGSDRPYEELSNQELHARLEAHRNAPTLENAALKAVDAFLAGSGSKAKLASAWRAWRVLDSMEKPAEAGSPDAG